VSGYDAVATIDNYWGDEPESVNRVGDLLDLPF
jgi:hypothetical protein